MAAQTVANSFFLFLLLFSFNHFLLQVLLQTLVGPRRFRFLSTIVLMEIPDEILFWKQFFATQTMTDVLTFNESSTPPFFS